MADNTIPPELIRLPQLLHMTRRPHRHNPDGVLWRNMHPDRSHTELHAPGDQELVYTVDGRATTLDTAEAYGLAVAYVALAVTVFDDLVVPRDLRRAAADQLEHTVPSAVIERDDTTALLTGTPAAYVVFTSTFTVIGDTGRRRVFVTVTADDDNRRISVPADDILDDAEILFTAVNIYQQVLARQVLEDNTDDTGDTEAPG